MTATVRTAVPRMVTALLLTLMFLVVLGTCQRWGQRDDTVGSSRETGTTGSHEPITVIQTAALVPMIPGDSPQTLSGTFINENDVPVYVTSVTAALTEVTDNPGPCTTADYLLLDPVMEVGREVPGGEHVGAWSGATIQMVNNPGASQDGCKLATVNISYTVR